MSEIEEAIRRTAIRIQRRHIIKFRRRTENNPAELDLAKTKKDCMRPIIDPEIQKMSRAALFEKLGRPLKSFYTPESVRDTSEAACDTEYDADMYKKLANADPREHLFKILNPATGLPDERFTASVIERYRENQCDSSVAGVTAFGIADEDEVLATSVPKPHYEDLNMSE